ncbi:MAG TPA: nitroreductase family deazaflavin-dependent oxidoreductase [Candidatus Binatia bacterium]|nr:nitroreductase family deazaflavin-dependent oxidoreductase [Candidatus Binatia bacterium]
MRKVLFAVAAAVTLTGWLARWWRRHPRTGAGTVNRLVNPWLMRQDVPELSRGEIGLLEHVGRRSGTVRVTPVHPVRTEDGFRIIVPLGGESQWARNVLAAGHCRLQVGDAIHELDEPRLVSSTEMAAVPSGAAAVMDWLGFRYLVLRQFAEVPGRLVVPPVGGTASRPEVAEVADVAEGIEPELAPTT